MNQINYVIDYVLDKADSEPLAERIKLYEAAAELVADEAFAADLRRSAAALREVENRQLDLRLKIKRARCV